MIFFCLNPGELYFVIATLGQWLNRNCSVMTTKKMVLLNSLNHTHGDYQVAKNECEISNFRF